MFFFSVQNEVRDRPQVSCQEAGCSYKTSSLSSLQNHRLIHARRTDRLSAKRTCPACQTISRLQDILTTDFSTMNFSTKIFSTMNSLTMNSLTMNSLTMNSSTINYLTMNLSTMNYFNLKGSWLKYPKVHIFWEGHKFFLDLPRIFDYYTYTQ